MNATLKNARHNFGCFAIDYNVPCFDHSGEQQPFVNALHLVGDEIYKSEVDVVVRCKRTGLLVGRLGKVTELRQAVGQPWFKVDSTDMDPQVLQFIKGRIGNYANRPYFVSEHISLLSPQFRVVIEKDREADRGIEIDVVSWVELEV